MDLFKRVFKSYFNFTKGESYAFLLLLFIMAVVVILPRFFHSKYLSYKSDFTNLYRLSDSLSKVSNDTSKTNRFENSDVYEKKKLTLFHFNPNTISADQLISMGVYPNVAERLINYRSKVAPFQCKSQLLKVYGFSQKLFNRLSGYIDLPEECEAKLPETKTEWTKKVKVFHVVNLNTADTNLLIELPGIGSKLAQRIIAYRQLLGGFISIQQLEEVWGLKKETLDLIKDRILIDGNLAMKIYINTCSKDELSKHPYCGYKLAGIMINYRKQHGKFSSFNDLLNLVGADLEKLNKIKPYLSFQ
jgi:competence ComEA-like helix-hairpin-helix protein